MDKYDKMIAEALSTEDKALLAEMQEPNFILQAFGLFRGRNGWVAMGMVFAQTLLFALSVWAGWWFFAATDVLSALKWGLSAAVLILLSMQIKMALMPRIEADRVLRALRRLELRLARQE
jgi:hypothetical protein